MIKAEIDILENDILKKYPEVLDILLRDHTTQQNIFWAPKNSVCSQSYLYSAFNTEQEAKSFIKYIKTRFFRVLVSAMKITQSAPSKVYKFVPLEKLDSSSDIDWSKSIPEINKQLYKKYGFTKEEIGFVESMIKPLV